MGKATLPTAVAAFICFFVASAAADGLTPSRLNELDAASRVAWESYLQESAARAEADATALQREVEKLQWKQARRAPSGDDFKVERKFGDPWFASDQAKQLADAILSYQTPSGGWSKHLDFAQGPRKPGMQWTSQNEPGQRAHYLATFDNRSTIAEMQLLAGVWLATQRDDCRDGFLKGLDFIFAAQFPKGGWPQVYPLEGGYHDNITFNDDAMTHVLELLQAVALGENGYDFVDAPQRQRAASALNAGLQCVLQMQVVCQGKRTGWCAQHDPLSLQPAAARKLEPPSISGSESANLLRFLMSIPDPSPELIACIEAGLQWLSDAQVQGIRPVSIQGKTVYQADPNATQVYWARFYDLTTGKPIFPGRDGVVYQTFEAMAARNALGYDYYSSRPGSILGKGQKQWRKQLASRQRAKAPAE